ncbi:hypothetical protein ACJRO7_031145 [Eucalyptus globulus]|uniref:Uncharacterized protein n=1 Tax=Eucalyptus globulus TaxID=34317 RepID=A0ABD3JL77_EUCGL
MPHAWIGKGGNEDHHDQFKVEIEGTCGVVRSDEGDKSFFPIVYPWKLVEKLHGQLSGGWDKDATSAVTWTSRFVSFLSSRAAPFRLTMKSHSRHRDPSKLKVPNHESLDCLRRRLDRKPDQDTGR